MSDVSDAREAAAGSGIDVVLELKIEGFVKVKIPLSRAKALRDKIDRQIVVRLEDDDYGIDWMEAVNDLDGEVVSVEFCDDVDEDVVDASTKDDDD